MTTTRFYLELAIGGERKTILGLLVNGGMSVVPLIEVVKTGCSITLLSYITIIIGYLTGSTGGSVMISLLAYLLEISGKCLFAKGFRLAPWPLFFLFDKL